MVGKPSHALVEMYTQPIKIVIIAPHFILRGITWPSTAKELWKHNLDHKNKR